MKNGGNKSSGGFAEIGAARKHVAFNDIKSPACWTQRVDETVRANQRKE